MDCDGVLCDFTGGVYDWFGVDREEWPKPGKPDIDNRIRDMIGVPVNVFWKSLTYDFWMNLHPTDFGRRIWYPLHDWLDSGRDLFILTNPVGRDSIQARQDWIREHIGPSWVRKTIFCGPKFVCANPDSILVDDLEKNVDLFRAAGGHAVLVPQPWNSLHDFEGDKAEYVLQQVKLIIEKGEGNG